MSFDYGYTCPEIDKNINEAKEILYDFILESYKELSPFLDGLTDSEVPLSVKEKAKEDAEMLYDSLEHVFEDVRSINEDMRVAANKQIEDLEETVDELEHEIKSLEEGE